MTRFVTKCCAATLLICAASLPAARAQQTAVVSEAEGNKVYLKIEAFSLRSNLDTLFAEAAALQGQIDNLSWADVLENGTTPGVDVDFFGYDVTGIGNVTTSGTFTGDSLVLTKDATIGGRLNVTGVVSLGDSLLVDGTVILGDSLRVVQATSIGERLYVTGISSFGDSVHVVGNVDLDALFHVDGDATFGAAVEVAGVGTFRDTLNVDGATLLNDSLNVDGNTYLEQDLQVDGNTNIGGTVNITGAVTLGDALSVTGKTSLGDSLLVSGGADFASGVNVDGNTTLNAVRLDGDLDLNGNADISGTLDVHGATTLNDSLVVNGQTLLNDTLKVNAPALLNDSLHVAGGAGFGSDVTVDGASQLNGTLNVTGNTSLGGTLGVTGVVSLADSLHVTGGADFDSGLNVDGASTLNTLEVSGTTTLQGELTANGEATFNDTVHFNKPALFSDSASFGGNVNVIGTASVSELIIDGVTIPALDNTDALPEGDSNLYFTAAREAALQAQLDVTDSLTTALDNTLTNLLSQLFTPATSTTLSVNITGASTATATASLNSGGANVEETGFIISTDPNFSDSTVFVGAINGGNSMANLNSLAAATTYYAKPYVVTILGRFTGPTYSFLTVQPATLTTSNASSIQKTTATLNGSITDDGGGTVTASGFQWGTSNDWTQAASVSGSSTSGNMTANLTGLSKGVTYYFRSYATNEAGTAYGSEKQFTTLTGPCGLLNSVTYDGYTYDIVEIGTQCWFAENLRTEIYSNSSSVTSGASLNQTQILNATSGLQMIFGEGSTGCVGSQLCDQEASNLTNFGRLYNWYAVNDARGLCPTGWHVPTTTEWDVLETFAGGELVAGGRLSEVNPSANFTGTDNYGFTARPGGYWMSLFWSGGNQAYFATSTLNPDPTPGNDVWVRFITTANDEFGDGTRDAAHFNSVRCILN